MYRTFNMGIGMILILPGEQLPSFLKFARQKKMDAYWIGQVDKTVRGVRIS